VKYPDKLTDLIPSFRE
jgi:hypothetical protein